MVLSGFVNFWCLFVNICRYWDGRSPAPVLSVPVGHPFAAGDVRGNLAVVAAGGNILIYNIDQPTNVCITGYSSNIF